MGDPANFGLIKKTDVTIAFDSPLTVMETLHRVYRVSQFFDLVVGRSLAVSEIRIGTDMDETPDLSEVYYHAYAEKHGTDKEREYSSDGILIDPVQNAEEFSRVLASWLAEDETRATARVRLLRNWGEPSYDVDRLIAAANVFARLIHELND